jgi:EAL domain-containing protein (putative c-di-GMP-specific phosphodiesterase class I)
LRRSSACGSKRTCGEREELQVAYQPIVAVETRHIAGFEALARWRHAERGMSVPDAFIPLAEETGLIVPLGAWLLPEACRQAWTWRSLRPTGAPVAVSVNISGKQLAADDGLATQVTRALADRGLDGAQLQLELTESVLMDHRGAAATTLDGYARSA